MIWFKHLSDSSFDPQIVNIRHYWGREGVCRLWEIMETIARDMDYHSNKCSVALPDTCWKDRLGFYKTTDLLKYIRFLSEMGIISFECIPNKDPKCDQSIAILCPKLLELRDKRGANRVHKKAPEEEVDVEVEKTPPLFKANGSTKPKEDWKEDWSKISDHTRNKGSSQPIKGVSPKGMIALSKIGGMYFICQQKSDQMSFIRNDFRDAYFSS